MEATESTVHPERALSDAFFLGTLEPDRFDVLFAHLRRCESCRHHFDEVRQGYRAMSPSGAALARHEADLLKRQLIAEAAPAPRPLLARARPWLAAAFGAAATAAALVVALPRLGDANEGFAARGESRGTAAVQQQELAQVLCLTRAGGDVHVEALPGASGRADCAVGSYLMVASAALASPPHLTVAAIGERGERLQTWRAAAPAPRQLLDGFFELGAPGRVRFVALSTPAAVSDGELDGFLGGLAHGKPRPADGWSYTVRAVEVVR